MFIKKGIYNTDSCIWWSDFSRDVRKFAYDDYCGSFFFVDIFICSLPFTQKKKNITAHKKKRIEVIEISGPLQPLLSIVGFKWSSDTSPCLVYLGFYSLIYGCQSPPFVYE